MKLQPYSNEYNYEEAISLLSEACQIKYNEIDISESFEAIAVSIGTHISPKNTNLLNITRVMRAANWPKEQTAADIFIGRYVREYSLVAEKGRSKGLSGLDLAEIETLSGFFPPESQRDKERNKEERGIIRKLLSKRPSVELFDESRNKKSSLFDSVRIVLSDGDPSKTIGYVASYIRVMKANHQSDVLIARRIKIAMMMPRRTTKTQKANT